MKSTELYRYITLTGYTYHYKQASYTGLSVGNSGPNGIQYIETLTFRVRDKIKIKKGVI